MSSRNIIFKESRCDWHLVSILSSDNTILPLDFSNIPKKIIWLYMLKFSSSFWAEGIKKIKKLKLPHPVEQESSAEIPFALRSGSGLESVWF